MGFGSILQENREHQELTVEEIAQELNIQQKYIEALEREDLKVLPSAMYVHCFLKLYGKRLALDVQDLIQRYDTAAGQGQGAEHFAATRQHSGLDYFLRFASVPRLVRFGVLILAMSAFLVYIGFGLSGIIIAPPLNVWEPSNNIAIDKNFVEVVGQSDPEMVVSVNDRTILSTDDGTFRTIVNLQKGVNIIKIIAKNRHGKETIEYRRLLYEVNE
jgi:transcriptional regulator with XRE-family HTH domain